MPYIIMTEGGDILRRYNEGYAFQIAEQAEELLRADPNLPALLVVDVKYKVEQRVRVEIDRTLAHSFEDDEVTSLHRPEPEPDVVEEAAPAPEPIHVPSSGDDEVVF